MNQKMRFVLAVFFVLNLWNNALYRWLFKIISEVLSGLSTVPQGCIQNHVYGLMVILIYLEMAESHGSLDATN